MRLLEPAGQRLNQPPFHVAGVSGVGARKLDMIETALSCPIRFGLAMLLPGQVVEGPGAIGDAPMRHRTAWVEFQRLLKTLDALFVVEAVAPVQADIEPALGFRRSGGDSSSIVAEVKVIHSCFFSRNRRAKPCFRF